MFDFAPVGLGVAAAALAFLAFGWRLLPVAGRRTPTPPSAAFAVEPYLSEARLPGGSPLVGKTVAEFEARSGGEVVVAIVREGGHRYVPGGHWTLFAGDLLVLRSDPHALAGLSRGEAAARRRWRR